MMGAQRPPALIRMPASEAEKARQKVEWEAKAHDGQTLAKRAEPCTVKDCLVGQTISEERGDESAGRRHLHPPPHGAGGWHQSCGVISIPIPSSCSLVVGRPCLHVAQRPEGLQNHAAEPKGRTHAQSINYGGPPKGEK